MTRTRDTSHGEFQRKPLSGPEAAAVLRALVEDGWLIGVEVFGAHCCDDIGACEREGGFGLCDVFGPASVGSDCNRAEKFLLRPADKLMHENLDKAIHDEEAFHTPEGKQRLLRGNSG